MDQFERNELDAEASLRKSCHSETICVEIHIGKPVSDRGWAQGAYCLAEEKNLTMQKQTADGQELEAGAILACFVRLPLWLRMSIDMGVGIGRILARDDLSAPILRALRT